MLLYLIIIVTNFVNAESVGPLFSPPENSYISTAKRTELLTQKLKLSGPNCFNAAFFISGIVQAIRFVSTEEAEFIVTSSGLCKQKASLNPGDILIVRKLHPSMESTHLTHAAIYLSENYFFEKVGLHPAEKYNYASIDDILGTYPTAGLRKTGTQYVYEYYECRDSLGDNSLSAATRNILDQCGLKELTSTNTSDLFIMTSSDGFVSSLDVLRSAQTCLATKSVDPLSYMWATLIVKSLEDQIIFFKNPPSPSPKYK